MATNRRPIFAVNTRILTYPITGVQRYLLELLQRMPSDRIQQIAPQHPLSGARAHLWEQTVLPLRTRRHLLWSLSNTGRLAVTRQVLAIHEIKCR
jgi:hypothetical protein